MGKRKVKKAATKPAPPPTREELCHEVQAAILDAKLDNPALVLRALHAASTDDKFLDAALAAMDADKADKSKNKNDERSNLYAFVCNQLGDPWEQPEIQEVVTRYKHLDEDSTQQRKRLLSTPAVAIAPAITSEQLMKIVNDRAVVIASKLLDGEQLDQLVKQVLIERLDQLIQAVLGVEWDDHSRRFRINDKESSLMHKIVREAITKHFPAAVKRAFHAELDKIPHTLRALASKKTITEMRKSYKDLLYHEIDQACIVWAQKRVKKDANALVRAMLNEQM